MVSLEDAVTARYETGGNRFEILIDPKEAQRYSEGDEIDWEEENSARCSKCNESTNRGASSATKNRKCN